jgi:hypothetical protein
LGARAARPRLPAPTSLPAPWRVSAPHSAFSIQHLAFHPQTGLSRVCPRLIVWSSFGLPVWS